jgi:hypothetical protein
LPIPLSKRPVPHKACHFGNCCFLYSIID